MMCKHEKMSLRDEGDTPKDQARKRPIRRRKEARPGELVRAALETFVERGFAATSLNDVAERAGVSKGTIFLYFKNKEVLFKAAIEAGLDPAVKIIEALAKRAMEPDQTAIKLLRNYSAAWQNIMRATPMASLLKLLVAESGNFPEVVHCFDESVVRPAKAVMTNIVVAGIACGDFRSVTAEMAADMFFSLIWRCAIDRIWSGIQSPERFLEEAFEVLTRGIVKVPTN